MPTIVLCFFAGILTAHHDIYSNTIFLFVIGICACVLRCLKHRYLNYLAIFFLGYLWPFVYLQLFVPKPLSTNVENKPIIIQGYIATIPVKNDMGYTFNVAIVQIASKRVSLRAHLSGPLSSTLHVGERWQLLVRLRRPHALMNPGSFDLEKQYFMQHLQALGVVLPSSLNQRLKSPSWHYLIQQCREKCEQSIIDVLGQNAFMGIVSALTIGITHNITREQWEVFRATGTNHLVAISGLHIGLVSMLVGKCVRLIWQKVPYGPLLIPTQRLQIMCGAVAAVMYGILAGLSASTQRALVMILSLTVSQLYWRRLSTLQALMLALGLINLFDPFVALSMGFWLSFLAVSLLVYGMNARVGNGGWWWQWGRPQWVIGLGMMPILLGYFQQASILSIPANMIAIPFVSFLVVPVSLIGMLLMLAWPYMGQWLLIFATALLQMLWWFLVKLSHYPALVLHSSFYSHGQEIAVHFVTYLSLLPEGLLHRFMIAVCWIPCLFHQPVPIPERTLQLVVFDVGQGLAILVRTARHCLIYDTGNKTRSSDMGQLVILPYLKKAGVSNIDIMTISHGDQDHIGGADSILSNLQVTQIFTSVPERFKGRARRCDSTLQWQWDDGTHFMFLSPPKNTKLEGNNDSCVLKITHGRQSILLTGDIEASTERLLVTTYHNQLQSDVLVVPHHGSKTSSTPAFLASVNPKYAIFSYGYLNSYHHPHIAVLERYRKYRIATFNTVSGGSITMTLAADSDIVTVHQYRLKNHKIWHQKL